jgi:hypothetical protein
MCISSCSGPAHLAAQFVEKLAHGAVIKIAGILRENLTSEDGDRFAMACGPTFGIGIDDFTTGEHTGHERLASFRPLRHPAVRRPYGLFQIVGAPDRPITGSEPERDTEFAPRPLRSWEKAKGFHHRPLVRDRSGQIQAWGQRVIHRRDQKDSLAADHS